VNELFPVAVLGRSTLKMRLRKYWDTISSSFWFVPAVMVIGAMLLAYVTVLVDELMIGRWGRNLSWLYTGGADGASTILGTIAGSMMTIAGVVFSMTLVALTLASSQFGPRLLRNFMRDKSNQVVLGTFIATFLYCLLVLRTIHYTGQEGFVPHLSVTVSVMLALVSMGVLIYFIHHVSLSIQADEIIAEVSTDLIQGIERMFPQKKGKEEPQTETVSFNSTVPESFEKQTRPILSYWDGYIQFIDEDALMRVAVRDDLILHVQQRPGKYVSADSLLVKVWPAGRVDDELEALVNKAIILGHQRTPAQDVEFALSQLVEIAVRALSPGVNDPFTAIRCLDRIGSALCRVARREKPSPYRRDHNNKLRMVVPPVTFPAIVDAAFHQIRQSARSNTAVTIRLLETITVIAGCAHRAEDIAALRRHAEMIARGARGGVTEEEDRRDVEDRLKAAKRVLSDQGSYTERSEIIH
jgi:uncharacterized membrane protein